MRGDAPAIRALTPPMMQVPARMAPRTPVSGARGWMPAHGLLDVAYGIDDQSGRRNPWVGARPLDPLYLAAGTHAGHPEGHTPVGQTR